MKTNGKVSYNFWDTLIGNTFSLADSLGGKYISTLTNPTQVIYQSPTVDRGTDTEKILMWVGIGLAVLVLAVVLIMIYSK